MLDASIQLYSLLDVHTERLYFRVLCSPDNTVSIFTRDLSVSLVGFVVSLKSAETGGLVN